MKKNRLKLLFMKINSYPIPIRVLYYVMLAIVLGAFLLFLGLFSMLVYDNGIYSFGFGDILKSALRPKSLLLGIGIIFVIYIVMMLKALKHRNLDVDEVDERGVSYLKDKIYGSAKFMNEERAREVYEVGPVAYVKGNIFGQFGNNGEAVVAQKVKDIGNKNVIAVGPPGSGKTSRYVINAIYQSILRGESVVVADTKNDCFNNCWEYAQSQGYKVKLFNLTDPKRSNSWACLKQVMDPSTGLLDAKRLQTFAETYIINSTKGSSSGGNNEFWQDTTISLFQALISLAHYNHELDMRTFLSERFISLEKGMIQMHNKSDIAAMRAMFERLSHTAIYKLKVILYTLMREQGFSEVAIQQDFEQMESKAQPFTLTEVFYLLNNLEDEKKMKDLLSTVPQSHPAAIHFGMYYGPGVSATVKDGARRGLSLKLSLLISEDLRRILSYDDIVLDEPGNSKCFYIVKMEDGETTMKPISALFFTYLFRDLKNAADKYGAENRLPVNIIIEETYSCGIIPDFASFMSTTRARKIGVTCIFQAIGQLYAMYDTNIGNTIISDATTLVCFGTNDDQSDKFFSERTGMATVLKQTRREPTNLLGIKKRPFTDDDSFMPDRRPLMTPHEVRTMRNKVLISKLGEQAILLTPYYYTQHPVYNSKNFKLGSIVDFPLAEDIYREVRLRDSFLEADEIRTRSKKMGKAAAANLAEQMKFADEDDELEDYVIINENNSGEQAQEETKPKISKSKNLVKDTDKVIKESNHSEDTIEDKEYIPRKTDKLRKNKPNTFGD